MSGIYIPMEMPPTGLYFVSVDNTNGRDKAVVTVERMLGNRDVRQIVGSFELIPVPEHGRLIDADALFKEIGADERFSILEAMYVQSLISTAPTIIPAEPPKEET